jgi:hypothetical protein
MIFGSDIIVYKSYAKATGISSHIDPYINSVFLPLKIMSSRTKGAVSEQIFEEYATKHGLIVTKASNSNHDRTINGIKIEIKCSFIWKDGKFRFQQIRTDQDYDIMVFMSVFPDRIEFHQANKQTIKENLEKQDADGSWHQNQHGGKKINSGTFFFDCYLTHFPLGWMKPLDFDVFQPKPVV